MKSKVYSTTAEAVNPLIEFLSSYFEGRSKGNICVCSFANVKAEKKLHPPKNIHTRDWARIAKFIEKYDVPGRAVYFSVNTVQKDKKRDKKNADEILVLHGDLDFKGVAADRAKIEAVINALPLPPTQIIFSGHGLHLYWWLNKALPATAENKERIERDLERIVEVLACDPGSAEVARVLRVPGSHNTKFGDSIECTAGPLGNSYKLEDIEHWLKNAKPLLPRQLNKSPSITQERSAQLDALAKHGRATKEEFGHEALDIEEMLDNLDWRGPSGGGNVHVTMRNIIDSLLSRGDQLDDVIDYVHDEAEKRIPDAAQQRTWDDEMREFAISWMNKHPGLLEQQRDMPDWFTKDRRIKQIIKDLEDKTVAADAKAAANDLFLEDLHAMPETPVKWIVPDLILDEAVNGLFGDGATGKDLLLLMLCMSMTCGGEWLGRKVKQGKTIYMPGEDPLSELKRREARISEYFRRQGTYDPVPQFMLIRPMIGEDPLLAVSDEKRPSIVRTTPGYDNLRRVIDKFEPALVVVGNRVNIFAVKQNDDTLARQCLNFLHKLSQEFGCAIIMPAHPSLGSMSSGIGSSGSVQWNNGCRMRLYLSRVFDDDGKTEPDQNLRTPEVKKVNWVAQGEIVTIEWRDGVFVSDQMTVERAGKDSIDIAIENELADEAEFLRMLDGYVTRKINVSANPGARNGAIALFSRDPDCKLKGRKNRGKIHSAMTRLFNKGTIHAVQYGAPSDETYRIERKGLGIVK